MNTLPTDLINLISSCLDVKQITTLLYQQLNNEPYLQLVSNKARFKLAIKQSDIHWLLFLVDNKLGSCIHCAAKYKCTWLLERLYPLYSNLEYYKPSPLGKTLAYLDINGYHDMYASLAKNLNNISMSYQYYIYGRRGIKLPDQNTSRGVWIGYLKGCCIGRHYELFEKYEYIMMPMNRPEISLSIVDSMDLEYIVNSPVVDKSGICYFICKSKISRNLEACRFILSKYCPPNKHILERIAVGGLYDIQDLTITYERSGFTIKKFRLIIKLLAIRSDTKGLEYIYQHSDSHTQRYLLEKLEYYAVYSNEVAEYYEQKTGDKIDVDHCVIEILDITKQFLFANVKDILDVVKSGNMLGTIIGVLLDRDQLHTAKLVIRSMLMHYKLEMLRSSLKQLTSNSTLIHAIKGYYIPSKVSVLKEYARKMGIKNYQKMKKQELLVELITNTY